MPSADSPNPRRWSEDRAWWWDGERWLPANEAPEPPPRPGGWTRGRIVLAVIVGLLLVACGAPVAYALLLCLVGSSACT